LAKRALPRSLPASTTAVARSQRSCSRSSGARPRDGSARRSSKRRQLVLGLIGALKPLVCEIKAIERQIATAARARRRRDLHLVVPRARLGDLRGHLALRDRRLPRPLPDRRRARRRRRPSRGRDRVRQAQGRPFPLELQQAAALRILNARRQHPPLALLGAGPHATPSPDPAATTTRARSALSAAPGAASSGAVGKTASPITPPATAACNSMSS
jgi:hypothetical protein